MSLKPSKYPRWADVGGNIVEPSEAKKNIGWIIEKPPHNFFNWLLNLIYQWILYFDLREQNEVHIHTQADFEFYFGDSFADAGAAWFGANIGGQVFGGARIPARTTIRLHPISGTVGDSLGAPAAGKGDDGTNTFNGRPAYVLKSAVEISEGVRFIGDNPEDCIIIFDDSDNVNEDEIVFWTNSTVGPAVSGIVNDGIGGVAAGNDIEAVEVHTGNFTVGSSTGFRAGDFAHHTQDNNFYEVVEIPDATHVKVKGTITGTAAGNLSRMITGILLEGFTVDGRGGFHGMGGSIDHEAIIGNSAFMLRHLANSAINCRIINAVNESTAVLGFSGAIDGNSSSYNIEAMHIYSCFGRQGGGAANIKKLKARAYYCGAYRGGGGFYNCSYSDLLAVGCYQAHDNSGVGGGGFLDCDFSTLRAEYCRASIRGGGAYGCDNSVIRCYSCSVQGNANVNEGGGVYLCNGSEIYAYSCSVTGTTARGGGAANCSNSKIWAESCVGEDFGGGAYLCTNCEITAYLCTSDFGGAAQACTFSIIYASSCSAIGGNGGAADTCTDCTVYASACTSGANGGGVSSSTRINLEAKNCVAVTNGGGAYLVDQLVGFGNWVGNTAGVAGQNIDAAAGIEWLGVFIEDGAAVNQTVFSVADLN